MAQLRKIAPAYETVQLQHADVEVRLPGGIFSRVTKIAYTVKVRERKKVFGVAAQAWALVRGGLDYEASMSIHRAARGDFLRMLRTAPGSQGILDTPVTIIVSYNHPDWKVTETDSLTCMVDALAFSSASGPAVLDLDIPMTCTYIALANSSADFQQFTETNENFGPGF